MYTTLSSPQVLGPRWGGTNPRTTLASREYWDDVVAAGPAMGMSFVLAAVRDLPVADAAQKWGGVVAKRLAARGVGAGEAAAGLSELGGLLSPGQLAAETKLLSPSGTHIRAGSSLLLTMMPEGTLLVQGGWRAVWGCNAHYVVMHVVGMVGLQRCCSLTCQRCLQWYGS